MIELIDQTGIIVSLTQMPKRIISLVPSQTELLYDLGLEKEVVGITKFCIRPERWHKNKTKVGGTKKLNFNTIEALQPDLIIANKEENTQVEIVALREKYTVYTSDIYTLADAYKMMDDIGLLTGNKKTTDSLIAEIQTSIADMPKLNCGTVAYIIWQNPLMLAGVNTFINNMLNVAGFTNIISATNSRYPTLSIVELQKLKPNFIFLSSEPFPFADKHLREFKALLPNTKVVLVNGEIFSWYGSRLLHFAGYIKKYLR